MCVPLFVDLIVRMFQSVLDATTNFASRAATQVTDTVKYVSGVPYKTAESYLNVRH